LARGYDVAYHDLKNPFMIVLNIPWRSFAAAGDQRGRDEVARMIEDAERRMLEINNLRPTR
jgi:hypothetical protein